MILNKRIFNQFDILLKISLNVLICTITINAAPKRVLEMQEEQEFNNTVINRRMIIEKVTARLSDAESIYDLFPGSRKSIEADPTSFQSLFGITIQEAELLYSAILQFDNATRQSLLNLSFGQAFRVVITERYKAYIRLQTKELPLIQYLIEQRSEHIVQDEEVINRLIETVLSKLVDYIVDYLVHADGKIQLPSDQIAIKEAWIAQYNLQIHPIISIFNKFMINMIQHIDSKWLRDEQNNLLIRETRIIVGRLFDQTWHISYHIPLDQTEKELKLRLIGKKERGRIDVSSVRATSLTVASDYTFQATIVMLDEKIFEEAGILLTKIEPNKAMVNFYTGRKTTPHFASLINGILVESDEIDSIIGDKINKFFPLPETAQEYMQFELLAIKLLLHSNIITQIEELDEEDEQATILIEEKALDAKLEAKKTTRKAKQALNKEYRERSGKTGKENTTMQAHYSALKKREEEIEKALQISALEAQVAIEQERVSKWVSDAVQSPIAPLAVAGPAAILSSTTSTRPSKGKKTKKALKEEEEDALLQSAIAKKEEYSTLVSKQRQMKAIYENATMKFGTLVKILNSLIKQINPTDEHGKLLTATTKGSHTTYHTQFGMLSTFVRPHGGKELMTNRAATFVEFFKTVVTNSQTKPILPTIALSNPVQISKMEAVK